MQDLENKIRVGLAWSGFTQVGGQVATLVVTIILMRLLSPQDFGLIAMVLVFTGFKKWTWNSATKMRYFGSVSP